MSAHVLEVECVGKAFNDYAGEWARVARWLGLQTRAVRTHWVIENVSFRILPGESMGIVGQNGAGKSTLLKLVAGTTEPTRGTVRSRGRVAALLELGLGFNPELTCRENVAHLGGLMGLSAGAIHTLMPGIEAFAEIGEYFDQPIRICSSGMQMRVAFSVATAVRPDILIVDEALSVGDAYFVHKCFQRIREFRGAGTSLLIVSHDPSAIQALCDRALLLEDGRVVLEGGPQEVLDYYNALIAEKENSTVRTTRRNAAVATESGSGEVFFESVELVDGNGAAVEYVSVGDTVTLRAVVRAREAVPRLVFGFMIRDRLGQPIFGTNTDHTSQALSDVDANTTLRFDVEFRAELGPGSYSISVALSSTETHLVKNYQWKDLAVVFTVANVALPLFVGCAHLPVRISHMLLKHESPDGGPNGQS